MPRSRQRPGFRLAVAHHRGDDQIGIVESGATSMRQHVAQFAAFVDRAGRFRRAVTPDTAGKRELLEELAQSALVLALFRINLGVSPLEIAGRQNARRAMSRARHEDHVQVEFLDQPVQMNVDERQIRGSIPNGRAAGS